MTEPVTLTVAFHMCYRIPTLSLTHNVVVEVTICKMLNKKTNPKAKTHLQSIIKPKKKKKLNQKEKH